VSRKLKRGSVRSKVPKVPRAGLGWTTKRRDIHHRVITDARLTLAALTVMAVFLDRSDDSGKPVWGSQKNLARQLKWSVKTVQRAIKELVALGYLKVYHSRPERGPDGQYCYRKTNIYYVCLPGRDKASLPAPRRRLRGQYCTVPTGVQHSSDLGDNGGPLTPFGVSQPRHHPPGEYENESSTHPKTKIPPGRRLLEDTPGGVTATEEVYTPPDPATKASVMAAMRQQRQQLKPTLQPPP
jgi:hypothetical protein